MNENTFVIYHRADNDGLCCREIARHFLPGAELIGLDYNEPAPFIPQDARLYILDLSVPELMGHPGLVWIDHHKTAIERFPASIPGYRIDGVAACRLAWQWFACSAFAEKSGASLTVFTLPTKQAYIDRAVDEPLAVRLIGENDIWDHRDPRVALFGAGLDSQEINWQLLLDPKLRATTPYAEDLLRDAVPVAYARRKGLRRLIEEGSFPLAWQGLRFLAINAAGLSSTAYELAPEADIYDAGLSFTWSPKLSRWKVSMRALRPGLDLTPIASAFGGGGHPAACGFSCKSLPFSLPKIEEGTDDAAAKERLKSAGRVLDGLFDGRAWALFVMPSAQGDFAHYISNADREDVVGAMRGLIEGGEAARLPTPDPARN